jgi:hypothetical protein
VCVVEFSIDVTDTITGKTKSYVNPMGQFTSMGDINAFQGSWSAPQPR